MEPLILGSQSTERRSNAAASRNGHNLVFLVVNREDGTSVRRPTDRPICGCRDRDRVNHQTPLALERIFAADLIQVVGRRGPPACWLSTNGIVLETRVLNRNRCPSVPAILEQKLHLV